MHDSDTEQCADMRLQLEGQIFVWIENFRRSQTKIPSRAEAIRQLLARAIGADRRESVSSP
jgi:hypothetical protein